DLDTFFVSAHRSRDLSLNNRPVAVGGRSNLKIFEKEKVGIKLYNSNHGAFVNPVFYNAGQNDFERFFVDHRVKGNRRIRGIVVTSSYEARARGVKTGMPLAQALRLCPDMEVLVPDYLLYHDLSHRLHLFLKEQIPQVEQFSIDEFFGDLNGWVGEEEVFAYAAHLKAQIWHRFHLPISIGISSAKWIAKLATKHAKPNGIHMVREEEIPAFIEDVPIQEFPGIGRGFARRLEKHFIRTLGEASRAKELFYSWKKPGRVLYHRIVGDDGEGVSFRNDRKSIGISRTFDPICDKTEVLRRVLILARHIVFLVLRHRVNPTSYYLKINYDNGVRMKQRITQDRLFSEQLCKETFQTLFAACDTFGGCATKISMSVSNFTYQKHATLSLLDFDRDHPSNRLSRSLQHLREKYSLDIVKTGGEL
ncbi:MAG TPA: DNA polymerase IV, partial [Campylobacteraceae bacterium]|nr:DNA polymerase IV [Campylobacteraceae bacterium]